MKKLSILIIFIISISNSIFAQNKILNKKIDISVENKSVEFTFDEISKKANCFFSYNSDILKADSLITIKKKNISIEEIINQIFHNKIYALESGNYIILKTKSASKNKGIISDKKTKYIITGSIYNSITGEKIENASVYQIGQTNSTLTNLYGNYKLEVSTKKNEAGFAFSAKDYIDTIIVIQPSDTIISIGLLPEIALLNKKNYPSIEPVNKEIEFQKIPIVEYAVPKKQFSLSENLKFIEKQPFQISIIPNIGTNNLMSGNVENNFSFNILGGYSYSIKGVEIGSLINIVRNEVTGVQVCGFGNITGKDVKGAQVAGFFNNNRGNLTGFQVAGFSNFVADSIYGIQLAGFSNIVAGKMKGIQIAGFSNLSNIDVEGIQLAGFSNVTRKNVKLAQISAFMNTSGENVGGIQITGFANFAGKNVGGAQIAGFANIAGKNVDGIQIAAFGNIAREVDFAQISAFINIAQKVKGFQIAFINLSDSVGGASIGFFSYVNKGFHQIEISGDETYFTNIAFKTGTKKFYNIFGAGINVLDTKYLSLTYGSGKEIELGKRFFLNLELTGNHFFDKSNFAANINTSLKLNLDLGIKIFKKSGIFFGPSVNYLASTQKDEIGNFVSSSFSPQYSKSIVNPYFIANYWVGGRISFRI